MSEILRQLFINLYGTDKFCTTMDCDTVLWTSKEQVQQACQNLSNEETRVLCIRSIIDAIHHAHETSDNCALIVDSTWTFLTEQDERLRSTASEDWRAVIIAEVGNDEVQKQIRLAKDLRARIESYDNKLLSVWGVKSGQLLEKEYYEGSRLSRSVMQQLWAIAQLEDDPQVVREMIQAQIDIRAGPHPELRSARMRKCITLKDLEVVKADLKKFKADRSQLFPPILGDSVAVRKRKLAVKDDQLFRPRFQSTYKPNRPDTVLGGIEVRIPATNSASPEAKKSVEDHLPEDEVVTLDNHSMPSQVTVH